MRSVITNRKTEKERNERRKQIDEIVSKLKPVLECRLYRVEIQYCGRHFIGIGHDDNAVRQSIRRQLWNFEHGIKTKMGLTQKEEG